MSSTLYCPHALHRVPPCGPWGYADRLVRVATRPALDANDYIGRVIAVSRSRRPSPQVIRVLQALAADPAQWRHGYDLATEVHLKSGSLYPILIRLADREVLETSWEPGPPGRPPRHLYRLTPTGREYVATIDAARAKRSVPGRRLGLSEA
jgi:PadR family transcriptional regulator, regulatory protein PadR